MATLLIVEDDRFISEPLQRTLKNHGFNVLAAYTGTDGLEMALTARPDLVILDVMLPGIDGWAVCKGIREKSVVPILMLTALSEEVDRVLGLELGADDYLTKPFSTRELMARVKALLRRVEFDTSHAPSDIIQLGNIRIDMVKRQVMKDGQELALRFKEFELLSLLAAHPGEVVSRADIFNKVWGTDWLGDMRTLDVHIRWLREKLEDDPSDPRLILTVRGVGYRLAATDAR
jgi:DNA-binding response OmpR family regulator